MWGPLVLAGDLGPETRGRSIQPVSVPTLVAAGRDPAQWLTPVAGKPGTFRTAQVGRDRDVELAPFYRLHRRTYAVYWDLLTPAQWEKKAAELAAQRERQRKQEAATVGYAQPGEPHDKEFNQQGEDSSAVRVAGRPGRRASKWFSFDLPVDPAHPMLLMVTYNSEERQARTFEVLVDGVRVGQQSIERYKPGSSSGRFFDAEYAVPAELIKGKQRVTVRFQSTGGNETGAVFGIRMIRAGAQR
jgi:hypothetical protein